MSDSPKKLIVSSSPHAHSGASVKRIMIDVVIALVPAMVAAVYFFGMDAVRLLVACVLASVVSEAVCRKFMKRDLGISDFSAVITGILLAFNLPPSLPTWMAVAGSVFAIIVAKQLFGGIGYNPFNPALAARAALLVSRAPEMTTWSQWTIPGVNEVTTATPLGIAAEGKIPLAFDSGMMMDFFLGRMNGCIGEVSAAALILGALYMLYRRCITWHVPVAYIGTVAVFATILWKVDPAHNMAPHFHLLTGGLMLGALFMATDMVTTPVTRSGAIWFGVGCGVLTMVIRKWSPLPEGVSFSILIMNAFTPLINRATQPRLFGKKS